MMKILHLYEPTVIPKRKSIKALKVTGIAVAAMVIVSAGAVHMRV